MNILRDEFKKRRLNGQRFLESPEENARLGIAVLTLGPLTRIVPLPQLGSASARLRFRLEVSRHLSILFL